MKVELDIDLPESQVREALNRVLTILSPLDDALVDEVTIAVLAACEHLPLGRLVIEDASEATSPAGWRSPL